MLHPNYAGCHNGFGKICVLLVRIQERGPRKASLLVKSSSRAQARQLVR